MAQMTKEIPFGTKGAIARITVAAWMEDTYLDGVRTGQKATSSSNVQIIRDGRVVSESAFALTISHAEWSNVYAAMRLDPSKEYTRIGDKVLTPGAETANAINQIIEDLKAELMHSLGAKTDKEIAVAAEREEAAQIIEAAQAQGIETLNTSQELSEWEQSYNDLHNEGAEGYIPYRVSVEQYQRAMEVLAR